ncbi:MAG: DUF1800 family protein [Planctomycetota bacterium]
MSTMPESAWLEFDGTERVAWDLRAAAHLFRRAAFGATMVELQQVISKRPVDVVDELLDAVEPEAFVRSMQSLADSAVATGNVKQLSAWWAYRMLATPAPALEKMTLFWHGHFATGADKVTDPILMLAQNQLLRSMAFGDFSKLLLEISRDPAMLIYLDSATNRKAHPNENYAREIMELFCLGEGQYTEADIRELARCFTGWEVKRGEFRFNRFQHDAGRKSFLGQSGEFGGEDGVRIVLEQKSAPEFLVSKLIRYFVRDEPAPEPALIEPLAEEMRASGMQIRPVVRRILSSRLFFESVGRKVKSPAELAIGLLRCLSGSTNSFELAEAMQSIGQGLMYPPSVKGWDGGRTWINSSTLLGRSNLVRSLIQNEKTRFGTKSLSDWLRSQNAGTSDEIVNYFDTLLFAVPIPASAKDGIISLFQRRDGLTEGLHALCTLPEFQLS